jgi:NAD(P)H-flavin reductase
MPIPTYTLTCTRSSRIARDIYEITFTKPEGWTFRAGQFVLLQIPLVDNPADIQPRAYSIASTPNAVEILMVVKMTPGGRMSRWVEEVLKPGMTVSMQGPFGAFTIRPDPSPLLFISTSTGVAPFRSQIIAAQEAGDTRPMDLVFGVRSEEDLFWKDEFTKLSQEYESFRVHLALSQPSEEWKGHKGRVQTLVPLIAPDLASRHIYVCGSPAMTKEVKELCLGPWGMMKEQLHVEAYI